MIVLDPIQLFDNGFGPYMIPAAPPGASPVFAGSELVGKKLGKIPAKLAHGGWTGLNWRDASSRCPDYKTAKTWKDWGANIGFAPGDGFAVIDNDQGAEFSTLLTQAFQSENIPILRRYVHAPHHKRDAFFVRVIEPFIGPSERLTTRGWTFTKGVKTGKVQLLAKGTQAIIAGTHPETLCPYVFDLDHPVNLQDIPILEEKKFCETIRKFVELAGAAGWTPVSAVSALSVSPSLVSAQAAIATPGVAISTDTVAPAIEGVRELLAGIPNRDLGPGEPATAIDVWLNDYPNWRDIAYAVAAALGPNIMGLPEAKALFLEWSDGRAQIKQSSEDLWRGAIKNPTRFGGKKLVEIVRELNALPPPDFPALDPKDPALQAPPTPLLDMLRDKWGFFKPKGNFIELATGQIIPKQAFTDIHAPIALDLAKEVRPAFKLSKRAVRRPAAADLFMERPGTKVFSNVTYSPGSPLHIDDPQKGLLFNYWRPTNVPRRIVTPAEVQPWLDHVGFIMESDAEQFIKWCAFIAQYPELKPNWHYLIVSLQGLGKDTMLAPLKAAVGDDNWREETVGQLSSDFSDAFETKLLVIGETHQPKWTSHELTNRLKQALSKPPDELWVNRKFLPRYPIPNRIATVMFSNEMNPLRLEPGQRRVAVKNCRHLTPKGPDDYDKLWDWLNAGGTEATAAYLLGLPLSNADLRNFNSVAPENPDKQILEQQNVDPIYAAIEDLIEDGRAGIGPFTALLATAGQMASQVSMRLRHLPSERAVSHVFLDMEHTGKGVSRLRKDPKHPNRCGVVMFPGKTGERLWALADKNANGLAWDKLTNSEIAAIWQGKPMPRSAKVLPFPNDVAAVTALPEEEQI